jgi:hypothetical protein
MRAQDVRWPAAAPTCWLIGERKKRGKIDQVKPVVRDGGWPPGAAAAVGTSSRPRRGDHLAVRGGERRQLSARHRPVRTCSHQRNANDPQPRPPFAVDTCVRDLLAAADRKFKSARRPILHAAAFICFC